MVWDFGYHRKATLIYNPHAGPGDWQMVMQKVADFWQTYGWDVVLQPTQYGGHATVLAREAAESGHKLVIAAGGDGTLNEVANGLAHTDVIMAPLPVGTANSFARELGMPLPNLLDPDKLLEASQLLVEGRVQRMDVGQCDNGRYWLLWAGTGADGYVVHRIEPRSKLFKRLGRVGYALKVFLLLLGYTGVEAEITVDGRKISDSFLLINISNCRLFGGGDFHLNAKGVLDDGLLELWLFRKRGWSRLTIWRYALDVLLGRHSRNPNVDMIQARSVSVDATPVSPFHLDAEPVGNTPFQCTVEPGALRILVPNTAPPDLFHQHGIQLNAIR